jgi:hypothetical protein
MMAQISRWWPKTLESWSKPSIREKTVCRDEVKIDSMKEHRQGFQDDQGRHEPVDFEDITGAAIWKSVFG